MEEEDRSRGNSSKETGHRPRKNITVVKVKESSVLSDPSEDDRSENVGVKEVVGDRAALLQDNVKSVRFQSNLVQIQSYVEEDEFTDHEEKRTRN